MLYLTPATFYLNPVVLQRQVHESLHALNYLTGNVDLRDDRIRSFAFLGEFGTASIDWMFLFLTVYYVLEGEGGLRFDVTDLDMVWDVGAAHNVQEAGVAGALADGFLHSLKEIGKDDIRLGRRGCVGDKFVGRRRGLLMDFG